MQLGTCQISSYGRKMLDKNVAFQNTETKDCIMRMLRRVGINVLCHLGIGDAITQIILGYIRHDISLSYILPKAKEICNEH